MNEEDTFRVLRRPTFNEMMDIATQWLIEQKFTVSPEEAEAFFKPYGWTQKEFRTNLGELRDKFRYKWQKDK